MDIITILALKTPKQGPYQEIKEEV